MLSFIVVVVAACGWRNLFASTTIITLHPERAARIKAGQDGIVTIMSGVRPKDTGCGPQATPRNGCMAGHIAALTRIARSNSSRWWHLVLEDDAVLSETVAELPGELFTDIPPYVQVVNLGPNNLIPDFTQNVSKWGQLIWDPVRWKVGGNNPVLPGFGTLAHAYAVSPKGASIILSIVRPFACVDINLDTVLRNARCNHPDTFRRMYLKNGLFPKNTHRSYGLFGQYTHASDIDTF